MMNINIRHLPFHLIRSNEWLESFFGIIFDAQKNLYKIRLVQTPEDDILDCFGLFFLKIFSEGTT